MSEDIWKYLEPAKKPDFSGRCETAEELSQSILSQVRRHCELTSLPMPMRYLTAFFNVQARRLGVQIVDLVYALQEARSVYIHELSGRQTSRAIYTPEMVADIKRGVERGLTGELASIPETLRESTVMRRTKERLDTFAMRASQKPSATKEAE
jgi:hypothetical protein